MTSPNEFSESERTALIAELQEAGIKHAPEEIVLIAKTSLGKIIFLEIGKAGERGSDLTHIVENHQ